MDNKCKDNHKMELETYKYLSKSGSKKLKYMKFIHLFLKYSRMANCKNTHKFIYFEVKEEDSKHFFFNNCPICKGPESQNNSKNMILSVPAKKDPLEIVFNFSNKTFQ